MKKKGYNFKDEFKKKQYISYTVFKLIGQIVIRIQNIIQILIFENF